MNLIKVEFDTEQFQTDSDCKEWLLRNPDYSGVTRLRDFKLRNGVTYNMSGEKRHAWQWSEPIWSYTKFIVVRPHRYVLIWIQDSLDQFTTENIPPASALSLEKLRKQKAKEQTKKISEEKKKAARRHARAEKKRQKLEDAGQDSDSESEPITKKAKKEPATPKPKNPHLFKKKVKPCGRPLEASPLPRSDSVVATLNVETV